MPIKVYVADAVTGLTSERYLVDAREMVALDPRYTILDAPEAIADAAGFPIDAPWTRHGGRKGHFEVSRVRTEWVETP